MEHSNTLELLKITMELYDIPKKEIQSFLNLERIQLYAFLRDRLTYPELIELQIILNNIYNNVENKDKIDFTEYCPISLKHQEKTCTILLNKCLKDSNCLLAICTIIAMEPKEIIENYLYYN